MNKAAMVGSSLASADSTSDVMSLEETQLAAISASDHSLQITIHKLNGKNYLEWSTSVQLVIDGKGKFGYLNGDVQAPDSGDLKYRQWRSENSIVTAWLINSMDPVIGKSFMFLRTARDVWEAVKETYELDMFEEEWESNSDSARYKKKKYEEKRQVILKNIHEESALVA
ncbi:hypothetical protein CR513_56119, partial [Mucuna pruriens]